MKKHLINSALWKPWFFCLPVLYNLQPQPDSSHHQMVQMLLIKGCEMDDKGAINGLVKPITKYILSNISCRKITKLKIQRQLIILQQEISTIIQDDGNQITEIFDFEQ